MIHFQFSYIKHDEYMIEVGTTFTTTVVVYDLYFRNICIHYK